jgi:CDP-diacylglycerol---glycerol-3-phosphate 3-phosphatidyltransferase
LGFVVSLYALKPAFQLLLQPHVGRLARAGVTANQVTVAAAIGSVAVASIVAWLWPARWPFLLIPVWLFVRMALNAVDGMLARGHGQKSRLGAYLNEISDVASDAALYAPFALVAAFGSFWIGLVIVLSALTELAGVLGQTVGASRRYDGPMGKSDRALVFGALGLWVGVGLPLPGWTVAIMVVLALALALTVVNRVCAGLKEGGPTP